jgi:hypothetical protein
MKNLIGNHYNTLICYRRDKQELEGEAFNEYLDRCIMEALLISLADEYSEKEEREIHLKELTEKKKRVWL